MLHIWEKVAPDRMAGCVRFAGYTRWVHSDNNAMVSYSDLRVVPFEVSESVNEDPSDRRRILAMVTVMALWSGLFVGCPTYEEEFTGRYQQVEIDELHDEAVAIDFFRFGGEARAVLRRYDIASVTARDDPFNPDHEIACHWTRVDRFDDRQREFELTIPATARQERIELRGRITPTGDMEVEVAEEGDDQRHHLELALSDSTPDTRCATIDDFLMHAVFDDVESNGFDPEVYELRNPVFALLWASVEPVNRGGFTEWVALNRIEPAIRLEPGRQFNSTENALASSLSFSIPPPAEQIRVESGQTRYALAHFVVIDDSEGEEDRFNWVVSDEPLVATALEAGAPDDAPGGMGEINGWGKALLFVEGQLHELHRDLRLRFEGLEEAEPARHFYIVDVFFYNDDVVSLRLPARPEAGSPVQRRVPVQVTEEYLEAGEVLVPRLFPY